MELCGAVGSVSLQLQRSETVWAGSCGQAFFGAQADIGETDITKTEK